MPTSKQQQQPYKYKGTRRKKVEVGWAKEHYSQIFLFSERQDASK